MSVPSPRNTCRRRSRSGRLGAPRTSSAPGRQRRSTRTSSTEPRDFLAAATPGAGKTTFALRLADRTARAPCGRSGDRRGSHGAPQEAVGRGGAPGGHPARPDASATPTDDDGRQLQRCRRHLRPGRHARRACTVSSPNAHRTLVILDEVHHGGRRAQLGRRHPRSVRNGHAAALAHRNAIPVRHRTHPVRDVPARPARHPAPR